MGCSFAILLLGVALLVSVRPRPSGPVIADERHSWRTILVRAVSYDPPTHDT